MALPPAGREERRGFAWKGSRVFFTHESLARDMDLVRPSGETHEERKELVGALPEWRGVESELGPGGR